MKNKLIIDDQFATVAQKSKFDPTIAPISVQLVLTNALQVDQKYQRGISDKGRVIVRKIIKEFDWLRFGVLTLAKQDDGLYSIIDGQHRAIAAFHLGIEKLPAVIQNLDDMRQAETFLGVNETRTTVGPIDRFKAKVASGDEFSIALDSALQVLEIKIISRPGYDLKPRETRSIGALQIIAKKFGISILLDALELLIDAQPDVDNVLTGFAMHSVTKAVERVSSAKGDMDRLTSVLENTDFETLRDNSHRLMKMLGGQLFPYGSKLLMREYNKGLRKPLSEVF